MEELKEKKEHKYLFKFIKILIIFILLLAIFLLYSRFISTKGIDTKEYRIDNSSLPDSFYGFKIAHITDIHYGRTTDKKDLEELVKAINKTNPDIVVFTGDLIDKDTKLDDKIVNELIEVLSKINATIGKYAIKGNHDYLLDDWEYIIKNIGFNDLNDTYEIIYNKSYIPISLIGISSNLKSDLTINEKISKIEEEINLLENKPNYSILLLHEPDYLNDINLDNYSLILAGHSHGGQVRLPFIGAIIKPTKAKKYYDEHYKLNNCDLYISYGIGTSNLSFRLFNKPSFNLYRLTK